MRLVVALSAAVLLACALVYTSLLSSSESVTPSDLVAAKAVTGAGAGGVDAKTTDATMNATTEARPGTPEGEGPREGTEDPKERVQAAASAPDDDDGPSVGVGGGSGGAPFATAGAGLAVAGATLYGFAADGSRAGQVWKQNPSGGESREAGATVTIWVNP